MGFLEDAGIDPNEIPDDAFGFGNDFWHIRIVECGEPKVTANQDKVGMMLKWAVDDPAFEGNKTTQQMRQWIQLPPPIALQSAMGWNPKENPEDRRVVVNFRNLLLALGYKNDEMKDADGTNMVFRGCLSKIKPKQNAEGFWEFSFFNQKPLPADGSSEGMNEFAQKQPTEITSDDLD